MKKYLQENISDSDNAITALGVRAEESKTRAARKPWDWDTRWGGFVWLPIHHWTIQDVLNIHKRHGVPLNDLYHQGFNRSGCWPCIFATKDDISEIARQTPERIEQIRSLETEITERRLITNKEKPGTYKIPRATYFQKLDKGLGGIDDVVKWSRTNYGGLSTPLEPRAPSGGCVSWGLCGEPFQDEE